MKTFKLHLIRHGITQGNLDGLYVGAKTNQSLCDQGKAALLDLKENFVYPQPDFVFCSPLLRATETANFLFNGDSKKMLIEQLIEADFGVFEGQSMSTVAQMPEFTQWMNPETGFTPDGAESTEDFNKRCAETLHKLFEFMIKSDIEEAACVTHSSVIVSMLCQNALPERQPQEWMADPGCGYTLSTDAAMWMRGAPVEVVAIVPYGYEDTLQDDFGAEE